MIRLSFNSKEVWTLLGIAVLLGLAIWVFKKNEWNDYKN